MKTLLDVPVINNKTESLVTSFPTKKSPGPDGITAAKLYQISRNKKHHFFFQTTKFERERILPNLLDKASITLIIKPNKNTQKRER